MFSSTHVLNAMRTGYSNYIPLSQLPAGPSKPLETAHSYLFPRRRIAIFALFTTSLLALFAFLRNTLTDLDDDFTDLDLELLPSDGSQSSHTSYLPFQPSPRPTDLTRPSLKPVIDLPTSCLDPEFARGELCYATTVPKLDFLWTWVNGSDPLEQQAKQHAIDLYEPDDPWRPSASVMEARLYRCVLIVLDFCPRRFERLTETTMNCAIRCVRSFSTSANMQGDSSCSPLTSLSP